MQRKRVHQKQRLEGSHNMKAKMTEYKGVYFRSRLEARWCEFFEFLGVRFEYEPEKQATSIGGYIPDFYFKSLNTWVEIKGVKPTPNELLKIKDVCRKTNKYGFIISGYPKTYPFGFEPHTANCLCYFISNNGNSVFMPFDEIYQLIKNTKMLHALDSCKPDSMIGLDFNEWSRYKNLKPAKAKFKPRENNFICSTKAASKIFGKLASILNKKQLARKKLNKD